MSEPCVSKGCEVEMLTKDSPVRQCDPSTSGLTIVMNPDGSQTKWMCNPETRAWDSVGSAVAAIRRQSGASAESATQLLALAVQQAETAHQVARLAMVFGGGGLLASCLVLALYLTRWRRRA